MKLMKLHYPTVLPFSIYEAREENALAIRCFRKAMAHSTSPCNALAIICLWPDSIARYWEVHSFLCPEEKRNQVLVNTSNIYHRWFSWVMCAYYPPNFPIFILGHPHEFYFRSLIKTLNWPISRDSNVLHTTRWDNFKVLI